MMAAISLIVSILSAIARDAPIIEELIILLKGPFSGAREPTAEEWQRLVTLAEQAHKQLQLAGARHD
ncbi:hypothetical protein N5W20_05440 [Candidatus Kirkpatrickella diaphorinae]|uniref:Uncharacterized protein n=1 Tax=Candidatus Kirkpatrickella diaphorinae TaxID=2984322 RepID=A0ABY6GGF5_9PROT|nr:hypothetical protein [Candidatus Kirkpatrickella diaphorinae]UYH50572.1 hypothetical protein N5W20_05440 [Candidatus Kirkpatrickella diaphorinae]